MSLKRDGLYLVALRIATLGTGIVTSFLVARILGPEGRGTLDLILIFPQMVAALGSMGIRASAVYFGGRGSSQPRLVRDVLSLAFALSLFYVGIGWLLQNVLQASVLSGLEARWVRLAVLMIPFYMFWAFSDGLLHGMLRFRTFTLLQMASLTLRLGLLVVFLVLLKRGLSEAVLAYVLAVILPASAAVLSVFLLGRKDGAPAPMKRILTYGLQVQWGNLAQRANLQLDIFILNPFVGAASVGLYTMAVMLAQLVWQAPGAFSQVLFPRVAASEPEDAARTAAFLSRMSFTLALVGALFLAMTGRWILHFIRPDFVESLGALWALLPGVVALSVGLILAQFLAGIGKPVYNSIASVIALAINIPMLFLLVPRMGIVGAGIATSLAYFTQAGTVTFFFWQQSGVSPARFLIPQPGDGARLRQSAAQIGRALRQMRGKRA